MKAKQQQKKKKGAVNERFWTILPIAVFSLLIAFVLWRFLSSPSGSSPYATGSGTGDAARDIDVAALVNAMPPQHKKRLADALHHWHKSATSDPNPSTTGIVSGPEDAPVKLTAWVDVECSGSRELVANLATLQERYPSAVRIDLRSFARRETCGDDGQNNVRCLAAMTRACLVGDPAAPAFDRSLFARGAVSPTAILDLAALHVDRAKLMDCLAAPTTRARVQAWMDEGKQRAIKDTPLVLANGRHAGRFFPFLELLILTRGTGAHPALRDIPAAR